jgi:predicted ATP-grasp superfamily ATP-dependent carboligase
MKCWSVFGLVLGTAFVLSSGVPQLSAQVCKDEEGMVADYRKTVTDLVETVKKESLLDFARAFHQKNVMTKMTLFGSMVDGMISCLQKRANDPTTLKEDADAAKSKIDTYNKLKNKIKQDRDALKAAQTEKEAKALIEKFAYTK